MSDLTRPVAIFNSSEDTIEMLTEMLNMSGFRAIGGHVADVKRGRTDLVAYLEEHDPGAVIWDIAPPYEENWIFFQLIRSSAAMERRGLVLTTTNKPRLDALAGVETGALEIIGKPYDLGQIIDAVKERWQA